MVVIVEIEQGEEALQHIEAEVESEGAELATFLRTVSEKAGVPVEELLLDLAAGNTQLNPNSKVSECLRHGNRWRHQRVCVDLHFESEAVTHSFPARGTWALVHRWGCRKFDVPNDACANLELRDGSATGPVLNDRVQIGQHKGCKTVWLVKPGPEPYGDRRR